MGIIAPLLLSVFLGAGIGLWARWSRALDGALVRAGSRTLRCEPGISSLAWATATSLAAGSVAARLLLADRHGTGPLLFAALVGWACALSVLGLIDSHRFVLPTSLLRVATLTTATLLLGASGASGHWQPVISAVGAFMVAGIAYGAWSLLHPEGLGFGDVRMACLVALGLGACSLPVALVALSTAPLGAGVAARLAPGRYWSHNQNDFLATGQPALGRRAGKPAVAIPLGPFLAFAGIVGVVAGAT